MYGGGGANGNTVFPGLPEENRIQYDVNTMPQLQLFGRDLIQCDTGIGTMNMENNHAPPVSRTIKRARESEPVVSQQKLHLSSNKNFCQDEAGNIGTLFNPNPVSIGLRLSCDEDERGSSVSSACENMRKIHPGALSIGVNTMKTEIDRQTEEFGRYIKSQEENILKGVRELSQRHTISLLKALENDVNKKLHEKDLELANMNRKNKELGDRINHMAAEAQSWHYRAKYNESVINVLKSNIQQLMAQHSGQPREGSGDSAIDDAVSCTNPHETATASRNQQLLLNCRACKVKRVSVLLLPCRHLCLCTDCEVFVDICPICQVMKTANVQVYM